MANTLEEIKSISNKLLLNSHYGNIITEQEHLDDTFVSTINKIYKVSKQDFLTQQAKSMIEKILNKLTEQELNYFKERFKSLDPQNKIIPEITKIIVTKETNKYQEQKLKEFLQQYKSKYKFNIHFSKNDSSLFYIKWHNKIIYSFILLKILSHQFQNISAKNPLDLNALKFIHKYNLMNRIPSINNNKHRLNEFYKNTSIIGTSKNKREYTFETLCEYGIFPEQFKGGDSK